MRANCWYGKEKMRVEDKPDPTIVDARDAIVRVTLTAICGSDLHMYGGFIPTMQPGDIVGHEFMGEIVELGSGVTNRKVGDRVVVAFPIACGECYFCSRGLYSVCERSNPPESKKIAETLWGHSPAGLFGYSHALGGFAGGQAEYVRVPYADVGTIIVPEQLTDEQALFLSDIFPTGWMAAVNCDIKPGDTVAVWGCGPVGQFAIKSAFMQGAGRVIAIDRLQYRLDLAAKSGAETVNRDGIKDLNDHLKQMTGGRGPDSCIDAVGMEAHATGIEGAYDRLGQFMKWETDRPAVLRDVIMCVRNGGNVSLAGVYGGLVDKIPMGSFVNRGLSMRTGQTHVQQYWDDLLQRIVRGEIDPSFVITHRAKLEDAPHMYEVFRDKKEDCEKVVLTP